jgi:hypothetical protein
MVVRDALTNEALIIYDVPAYGTSWGSCEEIAASIKEREWLWQCYMLEGDIVALIDRSPAIRRIGGIIQARRPTFPEALAEAFCQAVEASEAT